MQDFLLYFSPSDSDAKLLEAIHALYYLPQNYKLVLADGADVQNSLVMSWAMQNIMNRIRFDNETEMSEEKTTSPFLYADAVITGDPEFADKETPWVLLSDAADTLTSEDDKSYTVPANSPEALASALLRLGRARA